MAEGTRVKSRGGILARLDQVSVRTRLFLAIFGPSFVLLILATAGALISDALALRASLERQARIDAELLADATLSAVVSGQAAAATEILSALRSNPDVRAAAIYRRGSGLFASYRRSENAAIPGGPVSGQFGEVLDVTMPVEDGSEEIGTVWLEISLERFHMRLRYYSLASLASLASLSAAAAALARFLQRQLSVPFEDLAAAARKISGEQDYSIRAPVLQAPEFKAVTTAFNHMLERIERQNLALRERTAALETANAELSKTNQELEAFTYTVSHDLRTPLRAISSYAHLLRDELGARLSPEESGLAERIQKNAVKMALLIDELLAFSRLDALPLDKSEVEMAAVAQKVWQDLTAQTPGTGAVLVLGEMPPAYADPALIRQVFVNLLDNALKYSRERTQPRVEAGARLENGRWTYFVKDNGAGFDMRYADKLFGIFQRLHREDEFEGTGVGLAIVHRIITRHGGRIWAEGEPGKGAVFYFTLGDPADAAG